MHRFDRGAVRRPLCRLVLVLAVAPWAAVQPPVHAQEAEEATENREAEASQSEESPATTVEDAVTVLEEGAQELARVPGGTGVVATEEIDRTRARNLDDVLDFVPGVLASSRFGADEAKISIRGSGLRNNFHHRGTNILINGNPYQDADGFGDFRDMSHPIFQILDQDNRNAGGEVRYRFDGAGGLVHRFVAGVRSQVGGAGERRFENLEGEPGALVADFATESQTHALYAEAELAPTDRLSLLVGGRLESARREYDDRFLEDGDGSDRRTYDAVSPRVGFVWAATDAVEVFGNASRAYEPPLMLELNGFGAPGFLPLEAQDAWQYEVGGRGRAFGTLAWNLALYDIEIDSSPGQGGRRA